VEPLHATEVRVLGALLEKDQTTPEYYPLTLNALVNACNQKSSREPVVNYSDEIVTEALASLQHRGLALRISGAGHRVEKYGHRLGEKLNLGRREMALLCVLMLRGPQTVGELRGRSERLYTFDDLESVEATLSRLAEMEFVKKLPRRVGFKEQRWAHLLSGDADEAGEEVASAAAERGPGDRDRIAKLEADFAALKSEFEEFRRKFE